MVWIILSVVLCCGLAWLASGVRQIGAVSSAAPIGTRQGSALLLIDLQTVFWEADYYDQTRKETAKAQILTEVKHAKATGIPVIAVRQEWSIPSTRVLARLFMKGQALQGSTGTELAAPFAAHADHVLVKRVQDAFETEALDALLAQLDVGKLRIVGLDTNYCVAKTALAARQRGLGVEIVRKASLSADPERATKTFAKLADNGVELL